jgi:hypothetical protein
MHLRDHRKSREEIDDYQEIADVGVRQGSAEHEETCRDKGECEGHAGGEKRRFAGKMRAACLPAAI